MSNVKIPTYLLSPNWSFRPNGRIVIGNIVVDPLRPHRPVIKANPYQLSTTDETAEKNWKLSLETASKYDVSLWAKFVDFISFRAGARHERIKNGQFTMKKLVTVALREDPSDQAISALCNDPNVKDFMRLDSILCKPVYMVSGVKIAKGFALKGESIHDNGAGAQVSGEAMAELSTGGKVEASKKTVISDEFESEDDIVFAYQLLKIKPKGWKSGKKVVVSDYQPKGAFLADRASDSSVAEGEIDVLTRESLKEASQDVVIVPFETSDVGQVFTAYEKL